jgi:hypothetical protein
MRTGKLENMSHGRKEGRKEGRKDIRRNSGVVLHRGIERLGCWLIHVKRKHRRNGSTMFKYVSCMVVKMSSDST